jgi:SAM-dependent methyltransferase
MKTSREHYEALLAPIYVWMVGDVDAALARTRAALTEAGVQRGAGAALDLGCGFGLQAIPLAELGYDVTAIDESAQLLAELEQRRGALPIRAVQGDLRLFEEHVEERRALRVVVCMGDTLPHLPSWSDVEQLTARIAKALAKGGVVVFTFRDTVSVEPEGAARFVPVRSDDTRILTCFLDYGPSTIDVHDMLYTRAAEGWRLDVSVYQKLRVDRLVLAQLLTEHGLDVTMNRVERGMVTLVGVKR